MRILFLLMPILIMGLLGCASKKNSSYRPKRNCSFISLDRMKEIRDNCELPIGLIQLLEFEKIDSYITTNNQLALTFWISEPSILTSELVKDPKFLADSLFISSCYMNSSIAPILESINKMDSITNLSSISIPELKRVNITFAARKDVYPHSLDGIILILKNGVICDGGRFYKG